MWFILVLHGRHALNHTHGVIGNNCALIVTCKTRDVVKTVSGLK